MRSMLLARRLVSFDSEAGLNAPAGGGGAATEEGGEGGAAGAGEGDGGEGKRGEPVAEETPWQKKLKELRGLSGASDDDDDEARRKSAEDGGEIADDKDGKDGAGKPKAGERSPYKDGDETKNDADETKPLLFRVPARKPGDPDVELPLDRAKLKEMGITIKEARDRIGQLVNGFGRKQEVERDRAQIEQARGELTEIRTSMRERPVEFMVDNVAPKFYAPVVDELIARLSDEDFGKLVQRVARYDADPSKRRLDGADAKEKTLDRREHQRTATEQNRQRSEYMTQVQDQITGLVPEEWTDEQANEFYEMATFKLTQWAKNQPEGTRLEPAEVPKLLSKLGALKYFDLELPDDEHRSSSGNGKTPPASSTGTRPKGPPPKGSKDTGKDLRDRHDRRANAVTSGSGAGTAAAAGDGPPKGQTAKERFAWLRQKFPKKS